eukprot:7578599-Ditylum_brightwellii.AAC.1
MMLLPSPSWRNYSQCRVVNNNNNSAFLLRLIIIITLTNIVTNISAFPILVTNQQVIPAVTTTTTIQQQQIRQHQYNSRQTQYETVRSKSLSSSMTTTLTTTPIKPTKTKIEKGKEGEEEEEQHIISIRKAEPNEIEDITNLISSCFADNGEGEKKDGVVENMVRNMSTQVDKYQVYLGMMERLFRSSFAEGFQETGGSGDDDDKTSKRTPATSNVGRCSGTHIILMSNSHSYK